MNDRSIIFCNRKLKEIRNVSCETLYVEFFNVIDV